MGLWHDEEYDNRIRLGLKVERTLFMARSAYQKVAIVETAAFGKALLLDDAWMAAEGEEHTYHEMLVHPALTTAPSIRRVLVIGGGDRGRVREVLRHPEVEQVDLVEIDGMVIEASKAHLPSIGTAWDDPRLSVHVADGIAFMGAAGDGAYEVILIDSSDPVGPAEGLFGERFYRDCHRVLAPVGVLVAQSEGPIAMRQIHVDTLKVIRRVFGQVHPYYGPVSIYPGGAWSWAFAGKQVNPLEPIEQRVRGVEETSHYYNRDIHRAAFAQPSYIRRALNP